MSQPPRPSWRKPLGTCLILLLIAIWAILVASAAPLLRGLPWPVHAFYYAAAGIIWVLPLKPLLRWMAS